MKTKSTLLLVSATIILLLSSFAVFYPNGAPAGKTGSPGDGSSCTSCHGGSATTSAGWITSNIPVAGYTAGQTYQITATNSQTGSGKYGFEVSPQNAAGNLLGTLTPGTNNKFAGGNSKYITHTNASNSLHIWTFNWTAPAAGTGNVTFYGAFARNYTGSGPVTLSTLVVSEQTATLPAAAGPVTGSSSVCSNSNGYYSVAVIANATSYVWTVPSGATISSGQGTTSIAVHFGLSAVSGNVSVYGSNGAGNGAASNLPVTVSSAPSQPDAITGSSSPCQGSSQTYSVTNVAGVTYTWTVPSGSTINAGQGTNSITATMGTSGGNMNVVPSNTCGDGAEQITTITIQALPGIAGAISGPEIIDLASVMMCEYITAGATDAASYQWELNPADAGTINGSGLTGAVTWNGSFLGAAQIRVKAINSCGEGAWSEIKSTLVINTTGIVEGGTERGMKIYPSPNHGSFTVALNGISGQAKFSLLDTTGHELYSAALPGNEATPLEYHLSPGIYLVLVEEGTQTLRQKLVVQ
ncbi:MAG: choice-of-anchor V domain-containing protein [Bacteroidales bacterium]